MIIDPFKVVSLLFIFGTLYWFKNRYEQKIKNLEQEVKKVKNEKSEVVPAKFPTVLNGIFEIHVTLEIPLFTTLMDYVKSSSRNMKVVYAVSHCDNNQLMISHFTREMDDKIARETADLIAEEMENCGMSIARVKVESHGASGTPMTNAQYNLFCEYMKDRYTEARPYFEFHVKLSTFKGNDKLSIKDAEDAIIQMFSTEKKENSSTSIGLSFNIFGKSGKPLLTIRIYDSGFYGAERIKDNIMDKFKKYGYSFEGKIQQEFAVYDTNPEIDDGWLRMI